METLAVLLGEAWGRQEAEASRPFVGATGDLLNNLCCDSGLIPAMRRKELSKALWDRAYDKRDRIYAESGIRLTNVFNFQPPGNRIDDLCGPRWGTLPAIRSGKYLREEFVSELDRVGAELRDWSPNLIVGLGATALWFLKGTGSITRQRGAITSTDYGKALATFHPASLLPGRQPEMKPVVTMDLMKAARERHSPTIHRPPRTIYIPESLVDIETMFAELRAANMLAVDIETAYDQITCIGFAWTKEHALVIPIFNLQSLDQSYWPAEVEPVVWGWIRRVLRLPVPKVFQNGLYDIHYLWRRYGIPVENCADDTMLLHHALYPEMPKGLGFLGSLYTAEPAWKLMRTRRKEETLKDSKEE